MTAETHDLIIEQGATFNQDFILKDKTGAVIDLTGYTGKMQIREYTDSSAVLLELSNDNDRITLNDVGKVSLLIEADITRELNFKSAHYDLFLVNGNRWLRLSCGKVSLHKAVTR